MKYHSLKMEEVNDTMRHLWNKTYQGTGELIHFVHQLFTNLLLDIDSIKISSDNEGSGSRRSYNYRVRPPDYVFLSLPGS